MEYLTPDAIKSAHKDLAPQQQAHCSWGIRTGKSLALVRQFVTDKKAAILDCAPGGGAFLLQLDKEGYQNLSGLDIDDYRVAEAKKFNFRAADICFKGVPWPDNNFDAVVSLQTVEHLENPYYFTREVARTLKPGGIFIMSIPNAHHILNRLLFLWRGDLYHWLETDNHITFFTSAIFKKTFFGNFELLATEYTKPEFKFKIFSKMRWLWKILPSNRAFGRYVYFILKKK